VQGIGLEIKWSKNDRRRTDWANGSMDHSDTSSAFGDRDWALVAAPAINSLVVRQSSSAVTELVAGMQIGPQAANPQLVISTTKVKLSQGAMCAVASSAVCPLCKSPFANAPSDFGEVPKGTNTAYFKMLHTIPLSIGTSVSARTEFRIVMEEEDSLRSDQAQADVAQSAGGSNAERAHAGSSIPIVAEGGDAFFSSLNNGYYRRFFVEIRRIGAGSFGLVCLCRHVLEGIHLGDFAVKIVGVGNDRKWLIKAMQEVMALQAISHPNITRYYHCWLEDHSKSPFCPTVPHLFILMTYANSGSIIDFLNLTAPPDKRVYLSELRVLEFLADAATGLNAIHCAGILHKDLKPGNMLIHQPADGSRPSLLITDLGQADWFVNAVGVGSRTGATGTKRFLAPELVGQESGDWTTAADVWGLGMTLFALMFSALPLEDVDDDAVYIDRMQSLLNAQRVNHTLELPIPPCSRRPQRSLLLLSLVTGLLHPDPAQRMSLAQLLSVPAIISASSNLSNPQSPSASKASMHGNIRTITSPLSKPSLISPALPALPAFLPLPLPSLPGELREAVPPEPTSQSSRPLPSPSFSSPTRRRFTSGDPLTIDTQTAREMACKQRRNEIVEAILALRKALAQREEELLLADAEISATESEPSTDW
jgi:serine/threonine protein kinase